jgi:hypothetical protein
MSLKKVLTTTLSLFILYLDILNLKGVQKYEVSPKCFTSMAHMPSAQPVWHYLQLIGFERHGNSTAYCLTQTYRSKGPQSDQRSWLRMQYTGVQYYKKMC